ncbi:MULTISPECIES: hypothetical protein [unclassified Bradyrhizobium]|uniref:hypothetical protein n=1 Tax=unclassified Bradyrhizobium TaxID=2631580 RepID=UPI0024793507|nr:MULTISPECIES: hypothetical protein [unclassified Bradyrhizobium]WGR70694.1 hypothetical protein MTX24_36160 [Bradyrhizobium sp. ISRA426]WGR75533.1 hypothetical protein MTX21_21265 [Bradyrhizobium sp. ISRA430]WGR85936.1 hypothetical protein MTX25_35850 [Bradyrhizobium sp. ISRA432]
MLKYLAKISMDIFPSVLATIIGAYIVNHYINAKPAPDTPAAAIAPAQPGKDGKPANVANLPAPGVKAKGISEKSVTDKPAAEKPADKPADRPAETKAADAKAADAKPADVAPAETASTNVRGRPSAREKAVAKSTPAASAPAAAAPVVEANSAPAAASTAATPDANDLARAAIERLRKSPESRSAENKSAEPAAQESAHAIEAPRAQETPRVVTAGPSAVRPLPPPITVSTPSGETYGNGQSSANPPYTASVGNDDPNRLTPPADIPVPMLPPPLDLRADAGGSAGPRPKTNVADDMLSGMKSMFHAVLPKGVTPD